MSIYRIAGHLICVRNDKMLSRRPLSYFRSEREKGDEIFLLHFETNVPLRNWTVDPQNSFRVDQYICDFSKNKEAYLFRMALPGNTKPWLVEIHPDGGAFHALSNLDNAAPDSVLRFIVWIAFGVAALHRQTVSIHASAVMYRGKSVLFLGESGTGKSTHTRLWLKHIPDTELLNDDSPFLNVSNDISVYGSPWSGKTPCYKALKTPLAALVRLRQAPYNKIKQLSNLEAIGAVQPSFPETFAYDETLSGYSHDILSKILQQTPVYGLDCLPDDEAAKLVFDTLKKDEIL